MRARIFWTLSLVLILVAAFFLAQDKSEVKTPKTSGKITSSSSSENTKDNTVDSSKLIIGNADAPITIVEYADYKCPECGKYAQNAGRQIRTNYVDTGKVNIEFRPYPLFGEDAGLALYASYCAAEQGKFASYHDKLFDYMWQNYFQYGNEHAASTTIFTAELLTQLAAQADLDESTFSVCAAGRTHADAYNAAVDKAAGDSVQGTPTLIIGGQKVVGPQPYGIYKTLLDANL